MFCSQRVRDEGSLLLCSLIDCQWFVRWCAQAVRPFYDAGDGKYRAQVGVLFDPCTDFGFHVGSIRLFPPEELDKVHFACPCGVRQFLLVFTKVVNV